MPCIAAAAAAATVAADSSSAYDPEPVPILPGVDVVLDSDSKERDWANLFPELVSKIADDVMRADETVYIRLRAVCKPWRRSTADPSILEPRFFPRNWLLLAGEKLRDGEPERFVNVRTGASLRIRLPTPDEYTHHGNAEGLLVLYHSLTDTVCLLNPLTLAFTDLPSMAAVNDVARPPGPNALFHTNNIKAAGIIVDVHGAGRPRAKPTVVLSLTSGTHTAMVCAKPGDHVWRAIDMSCTEDIEGELPAIQGGLSVYGRFYVPTRAGDVLAVELTPQPRLTYVARQAGNLAQSGFNEISYLAPSGDDKDDGMLLLRSSGPGKKICKSFAVDLGNRRLTLQELSDTTVFLPSVTLRSSVFPSVLQNRAYMEKHMKLLLRGRYI